MGLGSTPWEPFPWLERASATLALLPDENQYEKRRPEPLVFLIRDLPTLEPHSISVSKGEYSSLGGRLAD